MEFKFPFVEVVPIQDFNSTSAGMALFAGDRLKFECRTDKWGIDGGIDEVGRQYLREIKAKILEH